MAGTEIACLNQFANEYARKDEEVHESAFDFDPRDLTVREIVSRTVGPFPAFKRDAPGFEALFTGSIVYRELADRIPSPTRSSSKKSPGSYSSAVRASARRTSLSARRSAAKS